MSMEDFADWLRTTYRTTRGTSLQSAPQADAKSRCKRVEDLEGDLDGHFARDGLRSLLNQLTYTAGDAAQGHTPKHHIPIDGNMVTGTASLRSAIRLYQLFCQRWPPYDTEDIPEKTP